MFYGTQQVAKILDVRPSRLTRAIWEQRFSPPAKGPGGAFVWSEHDIRRAAWVLLHRTLDAETVAAIRKDQNQNNSGGAA